MTSTSQSRILPVCVAQSEISVASSGVDSKVTGASAGSGSRSTSSSSSNSSNSMNDGCGDLDGNFSSVTGSNVLLRGGSSLVPSEVGGGAGVMGGATSVGGSTVGSNVMFKDGTSSVAGSEFDSVVGYTWRESGGGPTSAPTSEVGMGWHGRGSEISQGGRVSGAGGQGRSRDGSVDEAGTGSRVGVSAVGSSQRNVNLHAAAKQAKRRRFTG